MLDVNLASETVADALRTGQVGTPVAVRVVSHLTADHGLLEREAARTLKSASAWLNSRPDQLTAFGSVEAGQVSTLTRFVDGQTALVSVGSCGIGQPLLEIVVTGSRGILSWEGQSGSFAIRADGDEQELSDQANQILDRIRESLQSGRSAEFGRRESNRHSGGRSKRGTRLRPFPPLRRCRALCR